MQEQIQNKTLGALLINTIYNYYLYTLRLQLIAGTNFSVFALRVFGIY